PSAAPWLPACDPIRRRAAPHESGREPSRRPLSRSPAPPPGGAGRPRPPGPCPKLRSILWSSSHPARRLARNAGFGELRDDRRAEGGQVRGGTAGCELAVDDELLVDCLGAREAQVGPQARPGGERVTADKSGSHERLDKANRIRADP